MIHAQKKGVLKTVAILVLVMATILILFLNKITTPRYLSNIELKINGLVWLEQPQLIPVEGEGWQLLATTPEQFQFLEQVLPQLKSRISQQTEALLIDDESLDILNKTATVYDPVIGVVSNKRLLAYLKPPFDEHKFLLTYSSVVAHR